jgi:glycosyltransferase involved in cell wall biosynthesis
MSVYNDKKYLAQAIESILAQTFGDFEFLILDDASTDGSAAIIESYAEKDRRIRILANPKNIGLGASLKKGVEAAGGEFIARMDADDISPKDRFQKQVDYLTKHPDIKILGGDHTIIDDEGSPISKLFYPKSSGLMRWNMLLGNGLIVSNGATMMRKEFIEMIGGYSAYRAAQDYELWTRLLEYEPFPIANMADIILYYRQHDETITKSSNSLQEKVAVQVRKQKIEGLLGRAISEEVVLAYRRTSWQYTDIEHDMLTWIEVYQKFVQRFNVKKEEHAQIKAELLQRINNYIYVDPFRKASLGRKSFWTMLSSFPLEISVALLTYKTKYLKFDPERTS